MKTTQFALWSVVALAMGTPGVSGQQPVFPGKTWPRATPEEVGMDRTKLEKARQYALTGDGSGYITRHGKLVMAWGDLRRRYDLKSTSKSIGVTALGLAIADGKLELAGSKPPVPSCPESFKPQQSTVCVSVTAQV